MIEVIRSIQFENFRGLPSNEFKLKGKSLIFLGANGKGKSSLVDGIEFLFSGQVSRFRGVGTGSINHDDAIQHVKKLGEPNVTAFLNPSNGKISRTLNAETTTITKQETVENYFQNHRGVDTFILRRAKILDFVCDQDADRYQKFIDLLGISHLDILQRCFIEAEKEMRNREQRAQTIILSKLAIFRNSTENFEPETLNQVLNCASDFVCFFGFERLEHWTDAYNRLTLLKELRPEANKDKIDEITRALVSLETPLLIPIKDDIITANRLRLKIIEYEMSSADASMDNIISEGFTYLNKHESEVNCPLCEEPFNKPMSEVLTRLKQRSDNLRELKDAKANRRSSVKRIQSCADIVILQLRKDLEHSDLVEPASKKLLRKTLASMLWWRRLIKRVESCGENKDIIIPTRLNSIAAIRSTCVVSLKATKNKLVSPDSAKLEAAIVLLEQGIASYEDISNDERLLLKTKKMLNRSIVAKKAFSIARESAIQKVFNKIAETVLGYYRHLHNCDESGEKSECTLLELKTTSRAATGGLRLAIQFLGLVNEKDPRAFLSDGHLDSLGLCLFLATVRIFNPSGMLLVLDDVLTSIDKEHRRRVGELLFQEFKDFQIILTTHDEHWYNLLKSSAGAWGIQSKWLFFNFKGWTVDFGPSLTETDGSWGFIDAHLTEEDYRELGGSFRFVLEDFIKRTAAKLEVKVIYKIDGRYTSGDFVFAGIHNTIRDKLIDKTPGEESAICTDIGRVFGQGNLVNFLSHDNPGRLEVSFEQAEAFVQGLRDLTRRCEMHKLIKGRQ